MFFLVSGIRALLGLTNKGEIQVENQSLTTKKNDQMKGRV